MHYGLPYDCERVLKADKVKRSALVDIPISTLPRKTLARKTFWQTGSAKSGVIFIQRESVHGF
jgi:hypothetical protein